MTITQVRPAASAPTRTHIRRDGYFDALRALAMVAVIAGHWLTTAVVPTASGWALASPLTAMPALSWVTLAIQPLTIFFLVGGHLTAASLSRALAGQQPMRHWLARRTKRIALPAAVAVGMWAGLACALAACGVSFPIIRTCIVALLQPLWFVAVYLGITVLTPAALRAARRWGWAAPAAMACAVGVVDLARYGPWAATMPAWVGLLNLIPGWFFAFQLGVCAQVRRPTRTNALALLALGAATWAVCVFLAGYPPTPMGPAQGGRVNSHPPSLVVVAAGAMFVALLWLAEPALRRLAGTAPLRRLTHAITPVSLSLLCWHQAALLIVSAVAAIMAPGGVTGLTTPPLSPAWITARVLMLPLLAVVLRQLVRLARSWETATAGRRREPGEWASEPGRVLTGGPKES